jgi:lysophospholipase L1-like esterase
MMKRFIIAIQAAFILFVPTVWPSLPANAQDDSPALFPCDHPSIVRAPYVWKHLKDGNVPLIEASMPGAYIKTLVRGTTTIAVRVDGTANNGNPAGTMPSIEYAIDQGEFKTITLTRTGAIYNLPLAAGLDASKQHRLDFYFRSADLEQKRWQAATAHLRLAGLVLDSGGSLQTPPVRSKRAIAYGDSITEGVGSEGLFKSWTSIGVNNARITWFPVACAALECEYGQVGTGGFGVSNAKLEVPPLMEVWDHYDASTSRLEDGRLEPEPDYIFCELGTNDPGIDITRDYIRWLTAIRKACPNAKFFCIVPPLGVHEAEVRTAVSGRNKAGDSTVYLIDTAPLKDGFRAGQGPTEFGYDGVHPSMYGHAMLGALVAVEAQKALSRH